MATLSIDEKSILLSILELVDAVPKEANEYLAGYLKGFCEAVAIREERKNDR